MSKKFLFVSLVVFSFAASGLAVTWNGSAGDHLWKTGSNWDGGVAPTSAQNATFYYHPGESTVIDSGTAATCATLEGLGWYGNTNQGVLTVQANGSLTSTTGIILGQGGPAKLVVNGGTVDATQNYAFIYVGHDSSGVLQMNSGILNVYTLYDTVASGSGHIQLDGGVVTVGNWLSMNSYGNMDITGGKMVFSAFGAAWVTTTYGPKIAAGQITGYGDKANVRIGEENGQGYLYAVPEPMTMSLLGLGALALLRRRK